MRYQELSYWLSSVDEPLTPRPPLAGDDVADVVIVGAGYTGLWTAYYLAQAEPALRIVVLESQVAGFGASGRNGGWCSALLPTSLTGLARRHGRDAAVAMQRAMHDTVREVGRVVTAEGIDCDWSYGGTVVLARSGPQLARAEAAVAEAREFGFGPADLSLLGPDEAADRCAAEGVRAATYTPHCAAVHPARLVRGLARVVERQGVTIHERTPVTEIRPGTAVTPGGTVRAPVVVRATEGYTPGLPGQRRSIAPVYSLMIATAPLPAAVWERIGLAARETFSDHRHVIIYGQRTADGRLAFGGRGAPYHFGSRVRPDFDREPRVFAALRRTLGELFPVLGPDVPVTHTWGGPLGIARDWAASVGFHQADGLAWAGGYVGDGVGTSNLAGRTLADLIRGEQTELTRLPWVNHRSPRWEPEPLRWLAVNAGLKVMRAADESELRTGRPSRRAAAFSRLLGH
ncbi:NAD(P)/FAD-dependent oxidoreductase [Micromonospora endophytica]|uniref:FAD-dependent oxidoreductase n=1 Tax=Micromonospora endophytica TaxID=515350 RepID=A0A2W2BB26_9ACTN|nr:FAD-dependent oxidoreductase [Micromonospora endophytica]PZF84771.1 FAD-dependent oxidoreductase [Micromonospora endophytica]RIW50773.1 FAD-dependent oxidoreductase [Micromonospora endophytica]BCJ58473.1 FAD-dependent oxidoreductase [Micromonospora endophytica]